LRVPEKWSHLARVPSEDAPRWLDVVPTLVVKAFDQR
jgi:hypothetical protein